MTKNKLLLLLALLLTAATGAWAQGPWTSGDCTVTLSNGTLTVSGNGAMADYTPSSDRPWYNNVNDITSVVVESGVTTVGKLAFYNFKIMTSVTLPEGLTSIGSDAFYQCVSVTDVNLYADPANLTWDESGCDDFNRTVMGSTQCHVLAEHLSAYQTKFNDKVNVTFVGDLKPAAPATYTVSLKDGVEDADKWTVKVGEGQAQALPIGGLKGDGSETVTLQYTGRLKVKGVKATSEAAPAAQVDPLAVPMTIEAITAGAIKVSSPKEGMQYSLDGGKTKNAVTSDDIVLNVGDKVQFYGNGTSITCYYGTIITSSGDGFTCKVYGNIMSLVDEENFATATTLSENQTFYSLFSDFITLTDASGLLLPATQLAPYCYYSMFYGCTALTAAPALPATQLAAYCYHSMFKSCTALTAAPALPATQLAFNCYYRMFQGCASLTTAPALPATQLADNCYREMFSICTRLTTAPVLPAETLVSNCYNQMFYNCSKLATVTCLATSGINQSGSTTRWLQSAGTQAEDTKTVYTISTADWPTINNNGIPDGWTRVNVDN